jgi:hypothetical protein
MSASFPAALKACCGLVQTNLDTSVTGGVPLHRVPITEKWRQSITNIQNLIKVLPSPHGFIKQYVPDKICRTERDKHFLFLTKWPPGLPAELWKQ